MQASRFTAHGVRHHEMYFPDGTCPTEPIMYRFLDLVEREPGALAVSRGGLQWGQVMGARRELAAGRSGAAALC